jgi:hypothetical protein
MGMAESGRFCILRRMRWYVIYAAVPIALTKKELEEEARGCAVLQGVRWLK